MRSTGMCLTSTPTTEARAIAEATELQAVARLAEDPRWRRVWARLLAPRADVFGEADSGEGVRPAVAD